MGGIKPELHESVLEIATKPCARHARGGRRAARAAPPGRRDRRAPRPHDRLRRHAPVRALGGPADLRPPALPRPDRRAALRRAPGGHLRPPRARRDRRRRQGHPRRQRDARARAGAARAVGQLAVLARAGDRAWPRPGCRSSASSRASACRPPTRTGTTSSSGSASWSTPKTIEDYTYLWYDVRPHPNFGTVEIRAMDGQTRVEHTLGAGGADPGDGQGAGRALRGGRAARRLPLRDARREPLDRRAPRPRRRDGRPPELRARADEGARQAALRPARRARAGPRLGRRARGRSTTCSSAATARTASRSSTRPTTISTRSCARSPKLSVPE